MPHFEITPDDLMGQLTDTFGGLPDVQPRQQALKRPKHEIEPASRDSSDQLPKMVQLLATLTLGHESQLQALAVQDTYILFLQPGTSSIIPAIQQTTVAWKQEVDQKTATQSLRLKLVTMISQALLDRMLKVAQASTTMDIWQEAIRHNLITEAGAWNYLSWNPQTKQVQVMQKPPISMTSKPSGRAG